MDNDGIGIMAKIEQTPYERQRTVDAALCELMGALDGGYVKHLTAAAWAQLGPRDRVMFQAYRPEAV